MAGPAAARIDPERLRRVERESGDALRIATEALTRLDAHEDRCGDRYAEIVKSNARTAESLTRIHERIDGLLGKWFTAGAVLIGGLVSIIAYLLTAGVPWATGG